MRCIAIIPVKYSMRGEPKVTEIQSIIQYLRETYGVRAQIKDNCLELKVVNLEKSTDMINDLSMKYPFLFEPVPPPYQFNMETLKE